MTAKPLLCLSQQAELLVQRGLIVADLCQLEDFLRVNNYYRFSGYAREFQESPREQKNAFVRGITLDRIRDLMELDRQLRQLILDALERIEVTTRSAFAYESGKTYGEGAFYLEKENYLDKTPDLEIHLNKIRSQLMRSGQPAVARYRDGDNLSRVPIWVAVETLSFGTLAKMCQYLRDDHAVKATADSLSIQKTSFSDTLHAFSNLRNRCAHYDQLWNRSFDIAFKVLPKETKNAPTFKHPGSYGGILVIRRWLRSFDQSSDWFDRVTDLLEINSEYREGILNPRMK
ncbi:Abi family protein [Trueperella pyogenes]|uniref:Abi family protein n=1 Tax=Trueperella pyogenes TaxID=1661 RepID=UPI00345CA818